MKNIRIAPIMLAIVSFFSLQSCWNLARISPPCPTITDRKPDGAHFGETVTIIGSGFLKGCPELYTVSINGQAIPKENILEVPNEQSLTFKVPKGASSGQIKVVPTGSTDCTSGNGLDFTYYYTSTMVSLLVGTFTTTPSCPTAATANFLNNPAGLDMDSSGNVLVADKFNNVVRVIKLSASDPMAGTIVGTHGKVNANCVSGCNASPVPLSSGASFGSPSDVDVDLSGNLFVLEETNSIMRLIRTSSSVEIYAGSCQVSMLINGPRLTTARLSFPQCISKDGDDIYFTDAGNIRKIDAAGNVSTIVPRPTVNSSYRGIEISRARPREGPIFVTDEIAKNIKFFTASLVQGTVAVRNSSVLSLNKPIALTLDSKGSIFIADEAAQRIFVIYPNGELDILAGNGTKGSANGVPGRSAQFNAPLGIALNEAQKVIYVSDSQNHVIRSIKIE